MFSFINQCYCTCITTAWCVTVDQLSVSDLHDVMRIAWKARAQWYNIGLGIGISADALDTIALHNKRNDDRFVSMLRMWLRRSYPRPTWNALAKALRSPTVNKYHLAEQILEQYAPIHSKSACKCI